MGVLRVADVTPQLRGSRPSRHSASSTRELPINSTMTTVVMPTSTPSAMICAAQPAPTATNAVASEGFSALPRPVYGTMPVSARVPTT